MTEKTLRPIVTIWLEQQGYYVAHEIMLGGYCDLTACRWAERVGRGIPAILDIMAVELKVRDISRVLWQAEANRLYADFSYAAMPFGKCELMRVGTLQKFKEKGVGLLGINRRVNIIVPARKNDIHHNPDICRRLWNYKNRHKGEKGQGNGCVEL